MMRTLSNLFSVIGILLIGAVGAIYSYRQFDSWFRAQEPYAVMPSLTGVSIPLMTPIPTATFIPRPSAREMSPPLSPAPDNSFLTPVNAAVFTPTPKPPSQPPTRLVYPKLKINTAVVEVGYKPKSRGGESTYEWESVNNAVGHHRGTANPGEHGNIVLSGHNNVGGDVFKSLGNARRGDEIFLYVHDRQFVYKVKTKRRVRFVGASEQEMAIHDYYQRNTPDAETLTLISCWPYATYTHRIYVVAERGRE